MSHVFPSSVRNAKLMDRCSLRAHFEAVIPRLQEVAESLLMNSSMDDFTAAIKRVEAASQSVVSSSRSAGQGSMSRPVTICVAAP